MGLDEEEVKKVSKKHIQFLQKEDPLFEILGKAIVGTPIMVNNVKKQPSYWLVPLLRLNKIIGFVRVLLNGKVVHIGTFYQHLTNSEYVPTVITGIHASEASKLAAERIQQDYGVRACEPVFVHDGPIGREAWLVEIIKDSKPIRWIFVTKAFIYERDAGKLLNGIIE